MSVRYHSVMLDDEKCKGCTNCLKRCPTKAIRVRNGKAAITRSLCIDCAECVRRCPHHAKICAVDELDILDNFKYKIALPAPSFYAQFNNLDDVNIVLRALLKMGFDDVYEVSAAAELVSELTRRYIVEHLDQKPFISTACPCVVSLIQVRFPSLIEKLVPIKAPVELAAKLAKERASKKTGLSMEDIGAIFITPCPAKHTAIHDPIGGERSWVDGAIASSRVYTELLPHMKEAEREDKELSRSGRIGMGWGASGGEASGLLSYSYLAADGIENVIDVLENLEDQKFTDLNFIELNACSGGCVGGVLQVENPYVAKAKLKNLLKFLPVAHNRLGGSGIDGAYWTKRLEYAPVYRLGDSIEESLELAGKIDEITESLPGLDCGTCGAPTCAALAEDIVKGLASRNDCIHLLREYLRKISDELHSI